MVQNSLLDLSPLELRYLDQAVVEISTDPAIGEERPVKPGQIPLWEYRTDHVRVIYHRTALGTVVIIAFYDFPAE
ncbi:hypothetical protein [Streptacidiphilus monticola]|uniref:DUF4258 domain-containing protein n=1 Tax=Streptacidiphilus monticola TaxID=2161674 RepID=A0ABW1GEA0_9ACTN